MTPTKPTHLLIPIEDLDNRFNELKELSDKAYPEFKSFYNSAASEVEVIKGMGKGISLNEKDIENVEINNNPDDEVHATFYSEGYKQALKDLL